MCILHNNAQLGTAAGVSTIDQQRLRGDFLACPFFMPSERASDIAFSHPARLPLGSSWRGSCLAPSHEQETLSAIELESCNLGYAKSCPRLPQERVCDAVRFAV